jgi:hypothetical protein
MADAALLRRCGNVTGWGAAGASAPWQDKKFPTEELVAFLKTISVHRCVCAAAPAPCLRVCLCRRENDDQLRACSPSLKKGFDDQHNGFLRAMKLQVLCARAPPALPMLVPQLASEHLGRAAHVSRRRLAHSCQRQRLAVCRAVCRGGRFCGELAASAWARQRARQTPSFPDSLPYSLSPV